MSSHMGTNFLNSCIKVPIDPCNNCPAPIYNRPKVFLSRSSTPLQGKLISSNKRPDCDMDTDSLYAANGMRSLATFYDSIPDYCEINHLPENEFYSTLENLKMTYRDLKPKATVPICLRSENSISLTYEIPKPIKIKAASSKTTRKKSASRDGFAKKDDRNLSSSQRKPAYKDFCYKRYDRDEERLSNVAVSPIKKKCTSLYKSLSMYHLAGEVIQPDILKATQTVEEKPTRRSFSTPRSREVLRKSFSINDLNRNCWPGRTKMETDIELSRSPETARNVPNINVQPSSPPNQIENKVQSSKGSHCGSGISIGKKRFKKHKPESIKVPFSFLGINECSIGEKTSLVSPLHPVARPNLAATLRIEVSKKKVKELQNNCTFNDHRTQVDWEVRKTPAWKSLSNNESHKEILALRLATRKAEQEQQKREYEMHMEIMRQRVKSAPLLLEGSTYWGPHVGKLSHSCYKDNSKHNCQLGANIKKKKKTYKPHSRKCLSNISYSRNSNQSTNLQESDELSSLDRAYL